MKDLKRGLGRREVIKASTAIAAASTVVSQEARAQDPKIPAPDTAHVVKGETFAPFANANPLNAKIAVFTTVSPDVDASIRFYRDIIGMTVVSDEMLQPGLTTAPGIGARRRHVLLNMPESPNARAVRILDASPGAQAIRPRPHSGPNDPGLLVLEGLTRDAAESYHKLASAGTPMISPPRYYFFRNTMFGRDLDVMSYAPFGPGGEQIFITANIRSEGRKLSRLSGLHGGFISASVTSLDQRPVNAFYEKAFGLKRTSQMECYQDNTNELIGAPPGTYFLWGNVGTDVNLEVWEMKVESGTVYPCTLDKTGLAMLTMEVDDLDKCRQMCSDSGIEPVGVGALPNLKNDSPKGFTLRGAVGELIEVVQA